jgi:hypothetical protein
MRHQVFSRYYQLSLENKVEPLLCEYVNHTGPLLPKYDFDKDQTYLECLECQGKKYPGLNLYYQLIDRINIADPYTDFE